jgi:hypothetical protein
VKYFLVFLFWVTSFLSPAQVVIKEETARYFLEAEDERNILRQKDVTSKQLIDNLTKTISLKDQVIIPTKMIQFTTTM